MCRVHLQYLGHPIANDLQYGGEYWGPRPPFLIPGTAAAKRMEVEGEANLQPQLKRQKVIPIPADMQASHLRQHLKYPGLPLKICTCRMIMTCEQASVTYW